MRHGTVMQLLVKRFVTTEQQRREEEYGITEDDVMEIRQDISTMRYELVDILRKNGMKTPEVSQGDSCMIIFMLVFDRILSEGWTFEMHLSHYSSTYTLKDTRFITLSAMGRQ
jgi:hypothetical protein